MIRAKTGQVQRFSLVILVMLGLLPGCNLLKGMHSDGVESNPGVLVADGKAAYSRGDYGKAAEYFWLAIGHDPQNSEARVGYVEAALQAQGFNLAAFIQTLATSDSSSGSSPQLVNPADWGATSYAELTALYGGFISVLDPIAQGLTTGPYTFNDVTVNLNLGFFYILRFASRVMEVSSTYQLQQLSKSSTSASQLGITQAEFDLLPDEFWWVTNNPPAGLLNALQGDIDNGIARLRVAVANTASRDMINDVIDLFASLQIQATP